MMSYLTGMPGLSASEAAIVVFILLLVIVAGRLHRWGEALGSYLYRRGKSRHSEAPPAPSQDDSAERTPTRSGPSSEVQPPSGDPWPGRGKAR
jgi:hypothetical protein